MSTTPTTKDIIKAILTNPSLDEEEKASLVEEFMNEIKKEYPELKYHATKSDVKEVELKLTKEIEDVKLEIEGVRKEIKEVELKLTKEIENVKLEIEDVRKEIKEVELKLTKEIENVRKEIKDLEVKLTKDIENSRVNTIKWMFIFWVTQFIAIITIIFKLI